MVCATASTSDARRAAYRAAGHWDTATLAGRVAAHAAARPDAVAVVDEAGTHTYRELAAAAGRVAAGLADRGVGAGSVVSIQLPNRFEAVPSSPILHVL